MRANVHIRNCKSAGKGRKLVSFIAVVLLCFTQTGCLTILENTFPNNKTIQDLSDANLDRLENTMPIRNKECVINHVSMCYSCDTTNIEGIIRTDGFYYYPKIAFDLEGNQFYEHGSDDPFGEATYRIAFYADKTYCSSLWMHDSLFNAAEWGMFEMHNDTIVTECFVIGNANTPSYGIHDTLLAKSPDTLVLLSRSPICPEYDFFHAQHYKTEPNGKFYYVPSDHLPDPKKAWIKRKKWFWCDEDEWKQYKKELKKMY